MRGAGLDQIEVESIGASPEHWRMDDAGNLIAVGQCDDGRMVEIALALDDPGYVITVIARRKRR
jgi:hypothetical protein